MNITFFVKYKRILISTGALIGSLALWVIIWQLAASAIDIPFILPSPASVFTEMISMLPQKQFISTVAGSLLRVFVGYLLGISVGAVLAFLSSFFYLVKAFLAPAVKIITAMPIASFILLCMLWMANSGISVFISFLMVFPIVYGNVMTGLQSTDKNMLEVAQIYGFSPAKRLILLYIPSALPHFASACITSVGLAWKAAVSAEIMCVTAGSIGYYIYYTKQWMETKTTFAYSLFVIIFSIICEYAIKGVANLIKKSAMRRYGGA